MIHKHAWTKEVDTALEKATKRAFELIGKDISGTAKLLAPVDTGRLAGSITYATKDKQSKITQEGKGPHATGADKIDKPSDKNVLHIGTNVEYAQHVEYGTRSGFGFGAGGRRGQAGQSYLRRAIDERKKYVDDMYAKEISKAFQGK